MLSYIGRRSGRYNEELRTWVHTPPKHEQLTKTYDESKLSPRRIERYRRKRLVLSRQYKQPFEGLDGIKQITLQDQLRTTEVVFRSIPGILNLNLTTGSNLDPLGVITNNYDYIKDLDQAKRDIHPYGITHPEFKYGVVLGQLIKKYRSDTKQNTETEPIFAHIDTWNLKNKLGDLVDNYTQTKYNLQKRLHVLDNNKYVQFIQSLVVNNLKETLDLKLNKGIIKEHV